MKLINLILIAAVFCSFPSVAFAQDNYSLWPRRPEELERARILLSQQKWGEAVHILQPFVHDAGVTGCEARGITGRVNVVRYLSRMHPASLVYTVKRGDTMPKISALTKCPCDLLMLYNGLVTPSALKVGQKLVYIEMALRVEIYLPLNELTVWDGEVLVASYKIESVNGISSSFSRNAVTAIHSRESYIQGRKIPQHAAQTAVADKVISLADGVVITGRSDGISPSVRLSSKDINELAQLVRSGNEVKWMESPGNISGISQPTYK